MHPIPALFRKSVLSKDNDIKVQLCIFIGCGRKEINPLNLYITYTDLQIIKKKKVMKGQTKRVQ